ncbi:hypothetical protein HPP92_019507 [Vanilla planifolia]|uniref:DUF7086 domain-containing protein n=1 Tax=Vanilla planifolia TaxID=51239 RepID=A0A835Q2F5_VANPL|nr:hypothetical protein HPP92_019507 [Vanilla planifolia]
MEEDQDLDLNLYLGYRKKASTPPLAPEVPLHHRQRSPSATPDLNLELSLSLPHPMPEEPLGIDVLSLPPPTTSSSPFDAAAVASTSSPTPTTLQLPFPSDLWFFYCAQSIAIEPNLRPDPMRRRAARHAVRVVERIEPHFPWAAEYHAKVRSLAELRALGIFQVQGNYICGNCGHKVTAEYDVETEFGKLLAFMAANEAAICNNSLPSEWREPFCPSCPMCSKVMKPEAADTMEKTNWLFLLLGQTIGHLDLTLLRYFCKHNEVHRTGSKDRLVCSTYLTLCSQLDPRVNHIRMN